MGEVSVWVWLGVGTALCVGAGLVVLLCLGLPMYLLAKPTGRCEGCGDPLFWHIDYEVYEDLVHDDKYCFTCMIETRDKLMIKRYKEYSDHYGSSAKRIR
jgi:hypothetical protein